MIPENFEKPEFYKYDPAGIEDYRYATNIVVSSSDREFFMSFVCARPYEHPRCVARIIVSEEHMKEIIAVLGRQLEVYQKKKKGPSGDAGGGTTRFQ